jgi:L-lactate utilization protein LutC
VTERAKFLAMVQNALGSVPGRSVAPAPESGLSVPARELFGEAERVRAEMARQAGPLLESLADAARKGGWAVARAPTHEDAAEGVADICRRSGVKNALRSAEEVFDRVPVDRALSTAGVSVTVMARPRGGPEAGLSTARLKLREAAFSADAGITGGDYAVAETGTLVVHPRRGLSRLISLAPPRHIAIVERGTVLPSLDELFILEREALLRGALTSSMNLISGPSRTGDIEGTIVQGIHGPLEAYLVLVG